MSAIEPLAPLDWRGMPLSGRVLIEASAGTGKTYHIGLIYLRLLLETGLGVEQILVATFTDAAAQELRERLRLRLIQAQRILERIAAGQPLHADDPLAEHLATLAVDAAQLRQCLRRIRLARADIDRAPISTIHALCQRIQRDHPLESGATFAGDPLVDEDTLAGECVEDFWRQRVLTAAEDEPGIAGMLALGLDGLKRTVAVIRAAGPARLLAPPPPDLEALRAGLERLDDAQALQVPLRHLLADADAIAWNGTKKAARAVIEGIAGAARPSRYLATLDDAALARIAGDACATLQNKARRLALDEQPCIRLLAATAEALRAAREHAVPALCAEAHAFCERELPLRARRRGVQTFSMLIDRVYQRLCGADADARLADRLFEAFPAALVDEFQDTDRRQFAIFDRIYRDAAGAARGRLVMIGDPKQAIYAFRGGDIAAYLDAGRSAGLRCSLATNHRSSGRLVTALNAFYAHTSGGFGTVPIRYQPVGSADRSDGAAYTIDGRTAAAPLVFHRFRGEAVDERGRALQAQGRLEALALDDCANRIAELLGGDHAIDGRRVGPGDIAVLLSTHAEVAALRERLLARGVPCVGSGRGSVFESEAAADLERILGAVRDPGDAPAVRGALATRVLGADYARFAAWETDVPAFERELERFAAWREQVRERGVLALVGAILADQAPRLLAAADGERLVTDLRHLGELLAEQESAHHGLDGLLAWLAAMRHDAGGDVEAADARRLRIESDAERVQLLTVHASKGLEYPLVFLPLAWRSRSRAAPSVLRFHDAAGRLCMDLGSDRFAAHRLVHRREELEERLRLFYVALTRAKYAVHVYWLDHGRPRPGDEDTGDAYDAAAIEVLVGEVLQALGHASAAPAAASMPAAGDAGPSDARERAALDALAAALPGVAAEPPFAGPVPYYRTADTRVHQRAVQAPLPALRPPRWLHSFSGLLRSAATVAEPGAADEAAVPAPDADAFAGDIEADDERLLALAALRGPRFGDAVHDLLEHAPPGRFWPAQRERLRDALGALGVGRTIDEAGLLDATGRMIDRVRSSDLGDGLRLDRLADSARVAEFEFQFPVHRVGMAQLRALCVAHGESAAIPPTLDAVRLDGLMTGFADLVFEAGGRYHVLDYKTNWLGARLSRYRGAGLDAAMADHHYGLQALLYTVALHRYLRQRIRGYAPERHLGESWYLFVRAIGLDDAATDLRHGVWRHRWPARLILALDAAFAGQPESVS